jgi:hypothetical protein
VLALTNGQPVGAAESLCLSVLDLATTGDITRDWLQTISPTFAAMAAPEYGMGTDWDAPPADPTPALPDEVYLGTYRNDVYGDAEIASTADGLALRIGPAPLEFPLTHYDRDTFSWQPEGENATVRSGLSFLIDEQGATFAFRDEYLGQDGSGILTRVQ